MSFCYTIIHVAGDRYGPLFHSLAVEISALVQGGELHRFGDALSSGSRLMSTQYSGQNHLAGR